MSVPQAIRQICKLIVERIESYSFRLSALSYKSRHSTLITVLNKKKHCLLLLIAIF